MKRKDKCVGKVAYSQKSQCIHKIIKFYETKKIKLRYYECPSCLDFHLTSKNADEQFKQIMTQKKQDATLVNVQNRERNITQKHAHSKLTIQREWVKFCYYFNTFEFKVYGFHQSKKRPETILKGVLPREERLRILATIGTLPVDKQPIQTQYGV